MGTEIRTSRIRRTWFDKLSLWRRAYETKVFDGSREAVGRGPTPDASRDDALRRLVKEVAKTEKTPETSNTAISFQSEFDDDAS